MKYSSGLTKRPFWFLESKKTAKYILNGLNKKEIIEIAINENIYQVESENRVKTIVNAIFTRLNSLPEIIIQDILNTDVSSSKILVLISVMKTDKLFFEFIYEIFRNKIILGDFKIENKDLNLFFENKSLQSEKIANWKPSIIKRLKGDYIRILINAGVLLDNGDIKEINIPLIDFKVEDDLKNNNLSPFLYAITGEQ
ncbi:MAG: DUF1819 family protein [Methanobrevibacter sp.]|jgi:hypothetical protein|nr:DUF1819 family protein [Candidatus Methanoflexus mossambicus]